MPQFFPCALGILLSIAGCATQAPAPRAASVPVHKPAVKLDWFHRQLAAARHARMTHLPAGDTAGAQRAYNAVMLPACAQVAKSGPVTYRARCRELVDRATANAAAAAAGPPCPDDQDDSGQTPAQITACSD